MGLYYHSYVIMNVDGQGDKEWLGQEWIGINFRWGAVHLVLLIYMLNTLVTLLHVNREVDQQNES